MTPKLVVAGALVFLAAWIGLCLFIEFPPPKAPERQEDGSFTMSQGGTYDFNIDGQPHRCVASKRSTTCRPLKAGEWR